MLTVQQSALLRYLILCAGSGDAVSPTFDQMAHAIGLKSKSGIHRLITGLEERGFIRRIPCRARAITILRRPGDAPGVSAADLKKMVDQLLEQEGPRVTLNALIGLTKEVAATNRGFW